MHARRMTAFVAGLVALTGVIPLEARDPPAPHCIDGRSIAEAAQADDRTLAIRGDDGRRHVLELDGTCPDILEGEGVQVLGWNGWVCGVEGEVVRGATRDCPIAGTAVIDTRAYADLMKRAHAGMRTLDRVVVQGVRQRGFRGTPDYCVANSWMRSWHETPQGIVVEVSPRRSGGHRFYRIEMRGSCIMQTGGAAMSLVSAMGLGMVCGNAGDHALFTRDSTSGMPGLDPFPGIVSPFGARCEISQVYPLER